MVSSDPGPGLSQPYHSLDLDLGFWLPASGSASYRGLSSDPQLCNDLELCDEAMALLDEVIMCTFQQSVYYLTKVGLCPCFLLETLSLSAYTTLC